MTIIEFLLARFADDLGAAMEIGEWEQDGIVFDMKPGPGFRAGQLIFRTIDAKRAILTIHKQTRYGCTADAPGSSRPCPTLAALAAIYADHPDYKPDWSWHD